MGDRTVGSGRAVAQIKFFTNQIVLNNKSFSNPDLKNWENPNKYCLELLNKLFNFPLSSSLTLLTATMKSVKSVRLLYSSFHMIISFSTHGKETTYLYRRRFVSVMIRSNGGQKIYFSDDNKIHFEGLIKEGIERFGRRIHAHCWKNNNVA